MDIDEEYDFGFTAVDDIEEDTGNKAQKMYDAILPLLQNLAKDSEKSDYIKWPNRAQKIDEFIKKLDGILLGKP